jgi:hypothetical protein
LRLSRNLASIERSWTSHCFEIPDSNLDSDTGILSEVLRGFLQFLQINAAKVPQTALKRIPASAYSVYLSLINFFLDDSHFERRDIHHK